MSEFDKYFTPEAWAKTCAEREAEYAAIDARYPINPEDPPEVQEAMRVAREVAKMDF
jgi:hypothetical protein